MLDNGRPETVWELCEQVCEAIQERPLNYAQESWVSDAEEWNEGACGTAYCRAGWIASLLHESNVPCKDVTVIHTLASSVLHGAGVSHEDISALFGGGAVGCMTHAKVGTKAYVRAGVKGMREMMEKYEAQLRAARINPDNTITVVRNG